MLGAIGAGYCDSGSDNGNAKTVREQRALHCTPHPRCFAAIVWICLIDLEVFDSETQIADELETRRPPHPGGNADVSQNKGVAGKAIRKTMKTKGEQSAIGTQAPSLEECRRRSRSGVWRRIQSSGGDGNGESGCPTGG